MPTLRCAACGLANQEGQARCVRCGESLAATSEGVWRTGEVLVCRKGAALPARCVKCGAPSGPSRLKQDYSWHHPALYILAPFALLIYAIVALSIRKTATLELGVCADHQARRTRARWASSLLALAGFLLLFVPGVTGGSGYFALAGVVMILAGAIWGTTAVPLLRCVRIDDNFVRLKGAGEPYLAALPSWGIGR